MNLQHTMSGAWRTLGAPGAVALAAALLACIAAVAQAPGLASAIASKAPPAAEEAADDTKRIEAFRAGVDAHVKQFAGRSMFFVPPAPPPPPPPPEPVDDTPVEDPPPSSYGGPAIVAMVGDTVWLADGTRLALASSAASDIDVVSINPPWGARLKWRGVEFDVPLFDRTTLRFMEQPSRDGDQPQQSEGEDPDPDSQAQDADPADAPPQEPAAPAPVQPQE
jgi:hypothetical protein